MKKKYIQLGAVALVLAALVGALIYLQNAPEAPAEAEPLPAEDAIYVLGGPGAPTPERAQISVNLRDENGNSTGEDTITLVKTEDDKFTVQGWEALPLNETTLTTMRANTMGMQAKRVIAEGLSAADLGLYGLDKPRSSLTVNNEKYLFGADAPGGAGVYVLGQNAEGYIVYLVAPYTAAPFISPPTSLIGTNVTEAPTETFAGFKAMTLSGASFPEPIAMRRVDKPEGESAAQAVSYATHEITSPIQAPVTTGDAATQLISAYGLVATGVAAVGDDAETLAAYGLDNPAAVIAVTDDDPARSFTLSASAPREDGTVYAQKKGLPVIYTFTADQLPWMELTTFALMDKFANMANIGNVKTLTVIVSDMVYDFNLEGEGDDMVITYGYTGDGLTADPLNLKNFRQFYQTVISARYEEELPEGTDMEQAASGLPILQFEFNYRDGREKDVVRFYKSNTPLRNIIRVNDGTAYLCAERYVQRVIEDVHKVYQNEEVKSYF